MDDTATNNNSASSTSSPPPLSSMWSFASGMMQQLQEDVNEFVESFSSENQELLHTMKTTSDVVRTSLTQALQDAVGEKQHEKQVDVRRQRQDAIGGGGDVLQQRLQRVRSDLCTFAQRPKEEEENGGAAKRFEEFKAQFELNAEENAALLQQSAAVKAFWAELVPERISEVDFWCRYWFRDAQVRREHQRRADFLRRKNEQTAELTWTDHDDDDHHDDDDDHDDEDHHDDDDVQPKQQQQEHKEEKDEEKELQKEEKDEEKELQKEEKEQQKEEKGQKKEEKKNESAVGGGGQNDESDWDDWE